MYCSHRDLSMGKRSGDSQQHCHTSDVLSPNTREEATELQRLIVFKSPLRHSGPWRRRNDDRHAKNKKRDAREEDKGRDVRS
jgi:hypothetical protein